MSDNKQVGETPSSEIANRFRSCRDLSDIVPLYVPRALYLKPLAKVNVSVSLPQLKAPGKTISTWEVMEKIRALILPDEFASLKVAKSTLEFIRLEGDLRDRSRLPRVLARLDSQRLNLAGFPNALKVRSAETKDDFPTRHSWDSYFRDAKHMNELKAGERPDTIHITGLPVEWFTEDNAKTVSESLIVKIFKNYEDGIFFDVYVQYVEYMDFVRAMDALRGMKLLKKDGQNSLTATIKVDFDKTKHMSDNSVAHRDVEKKHLITQDNLAAEKLRRKEEAEKKQREEQKKREEVDSMAKVNRQQKREEKRKRKALTMFRKQEEDKVSLKIAREEQKLIKAQRQLESIRLLDELFDRIKTKVEKKEIKLDHNVSAETKKDEKKNDQKNETVNKLDSEKDNKSKQEKLKKKKMKKEKKKKKKRKKTEKKQKKADASGSDSTTDEESDKETPKKKLKSVLIKNDGASSSAGTVVPAADLSYDYSISAVPRIPMLPPIVHNPYQQLRIPRHPGGRMLRPEYSIHHHSMLPMGREYIPRCDINSYALTNPYLYNGQYYEYFTHLVNRDSQQRESKTHDGQESANRSASGARTRSGSKARFSSASRSRSRRRSGSRSRSRGRRSRSRSRSRFSRSRSERKSRSRSRSRPRGRRKSTSRSISRRQSRSGSKTKRRSGTRSRSKKRSVTRNSSRSNRSRSRSRTRRSKSRRKSRSTSRSRSRSSSRNRYRRRRGRSASVKVTRAKSRTTSPKRRSRSSSWSMPKSPGRRSCSWSKSAPTSNDGNVNKTSSEVSQEQSAKTHTEMC